MREYDQVEDTLDWYEECRQEEQRKGKGPRRDDDELKYRRKQPGDEEGTSV